MTTRLRLLGRARVFDRQQWVEAAHDMRLGLLAYLAIAGDRVKRGHLAFLFWPDVDEATARRDLRHLIYRTKALSFAADLEVTPDSLSWPVETDVRSWDRAVERQDWAEAVSLYGGQLLAGLQLADSPEFMSWLDLERANRHGLWRGVVIERAGELESESRHAEAAVLLRALIEDDELDEEALRLYLRNGYLDGRRVEALTAYERFALKLEAELGLEPLPATQELVASLRGGLPLPRRANLSVRQEAGTGGRQAAGAAAGEPRGRARNFPSAATAFVGRELELTEVVDRLGQGACRLLTLVGPGGIGKSRLAQAAAVSVAAAYGYGVAYVPVASVGDVALLGSAIASALSLSFYDQRPPEAQLLGYLHDKEMLLLLDNLEQLRAAGPPITRLLEACPRLKILVTSRERLNLTREWLYHVGGMRLTIDGAANGSEDSDAVRLFLQCARRFQPEAVPADEDRASVVRICRLVGGAPLGIELAAGWLETLTCREIAEQMTKDLDFLVTPLHDVPERHRSLRRVFEHSWQLLSDEERGAFKRLSVFRSGFTREAAEAAIGVSAHMLRTLLDKALITRGRDGLFELHEMVKLFAAEKLAKSPAEELDCRDRHATYYADFLDKRDRWLRGGGRQLAALQEIGQEFAEVRSAWEWAVERRITGALDQAASGLRFYCQTRGLYREGERAFRLAAESVDQASMTHGKLLLFQGLFTFWLGRYGAAKEIVEHSLEVLTALAAPPGLMANAYFLHGLLFRHLGDLERAELRFGEALALARQAGEQFFEARALQNLGVIAESRGALDEAERRYRQAIAVYRLAEERYGLALAFFNLGGLLENTERPEEARDHFLEGLEAARAVGSRLRMAEALMLVGRLAQRRGEHQRAADHYRESLAIIEGRDDEPFGIVAKHCLVGSGETAYALGRLPDALGFYREGVKRALAVADVGMIIRSVVGVAHTLVGLHMEGKALLLLAFAMAQPGIDVSSRERVEQLCGDLVAHLTEPEVARAQAQGRALQVESIPGLLSDWQRLIQVRV